jgi:UDP-N-acetylmuramoyl-tripeptide--D-alanyl-D-alanine ligase
MDARSLKFVAEASRGELLAGPPEALVSRVCTDSRQVRVGDLFVALVGEKFNAHDYLVEVARQGAVAVLVERSRWAKDSEIARSVGVIAVENTRAALGQLASRYRSDFDLPVVAIGGSNGKTTTKELLASVLRQKFNTLWSEASFNNDVGVPVTLLRIERDHGAAIVEVGTNHPGELPPLLRMAQPGFGVLTNIGREHLEFFGDLAGVAQEEGWLAEFLPASGKLFINGDGDWTQAIVRRAKATVVKVGLGERNDWRAREVRVGEDGVRFKAESPWPEFTGEYRLRLLGRHQVPNALLALAAGRELGATPEQARRGLADCAPPKMRLQIWEANGVRVLDDSYNANADSMLAALQTLHDLPCAGRRVAVLGDMAELGAHTARAHHEIGRRSAELGVDRLVAVGTFAHETALAAEDGGLKEVNEFADVASVVASIKRLVQPGDLVLLKASRATGLEKVGEALRTES